MLTKEVIREYRRARQPFIGNGYIVQGRAANCLDCAKRAVWVEHNWQGFDADGIAVSNDGNWRLRIVPDGICDLDDLFGDTYDAEIHGDTVPGGKRTIEAQHKAAIAKVERDGVWGYILEKKCDKCGNWEHVDSCSGFECEVPQDVIINAQYQAKGD